MKPLIFKKMHREKISSLFLQKKFEDLRFTIDRILIELKAMGKQTTYIHYISKK
jgi:hypothetical protein